MLKDASTNTQEDQEAFENAELVLFHVRECYVYLIPPRKSAASYRADEWNVNKWAWEGALKIISKGEDCTIKLEDKDSGELYAQAPVRKDEPLPIERVIDSSRYFVLRIEDTSSGKPRHAFIGIGFRDRPPAYDFEAALYDHIKYLNKKKHAEEMEQEYQSKPSVDYSLKAGETIRLSLKKSNEQQESGLNLKSKFVDAPLVENSSAPAGFAAFPSAPSEALITNHPKAETTEATSVQNPIGNGDGDEEFGEFQTA